jgi:cell division protein FtsI (penicillin-binding protein 3)
MNRAHGRLVLLIGCSVAVMLGICLRALWVQVFAREWYLEQANWRHRATLEVVGPRGDIVDRDGVVVASSVRMSTLAFDPQDFFTKVTEPERIDAFVDIVDDLPLFDRERFERWRTMTAAELPRYRVFARNMWAPDAEAVVAALRELRINSVYEVPEYRRIYPTPMSGGHLLGFLAISDAEPDPHGVAGVERTYDRYLEGSVVEYEVLRDRVGRGYSLDVEPRIAQARGNTVELAIDLQLQQRVELAAQQTVEHFEAESAIVIVSDVETGAVRAMVSWPPFDPNVGVADPNVRYTHPAVGFTFEPGSTAKIMTFASAIDHGSLRLDETIDCANGRYYVGGYWVTDTHRMGEATALEVLQHSSNIGALRIGMRLEPGTLRDYLVGFGVGERSGVDLPGEELGRVRPLRWPESVHATVSYGYGFNLTPLQLNMATAAIANGGELMRPYVVERVVAADGSVVMQSTPQVRRQVVSRHAAAEVTRAMVSVTDEAGTGTAAAVPGFTVAGKTGTARLIGDAGYENSYLASFTGFVPAEEPRFAITALVLRPTPRIGYYGGVVAAPLFREAAVAALEREGIAAPSRTMPSLAAALEAAPAVHARHAGDRPPLDEALEAVADSARPVHDVPDCVGLWLHEALERAAEAGFAVSVDGAGTRVVSQSVVQVPGVRALVLRLGAEVGSTP